MSYEAWGDDDDGLDGVRDHYRKHLIEDDWLDEEQAAVLQLRIQDLERALAAMTARAEAAERDAERLRSHLKHAMSMNTYDDGRLLDPTCEECAAALAAAREGK